MILRNPMKIRAEGTSDYQFSIYEEGGEFVVEREGAEVWRGAGSTLEVRLVDNEIVLDGGSESVSFGYGMDFSTQIGACDLVVVNGDGVTGEYRFVVDGDEP